MDTTQKHLSISDIVDDILLLKDGGAALVLQVSAVNFGLLSDKEQIAIIFSFAQMLNSLSFSIQIVIHSKRLNLSSYLTLLDKAQKAQTNQLLSAMIVDYKQFIQSTIKDNEVLDKTFYIVIPLFKLELGLTTSRETLEQKIKTVLLPRKDQIIRQLNRVGLRANQLTRQKLIEVFYDIYNSASMETPASQMAASLPIEVKLKNPQPISTADTLTHRPTDTPIPRPAEPPTHRPADTPIQPIATQQSRTHPFVVEELEEQ